MNIDAERLWEFQKIFEGYREHAYDDGVGNLTIGVGHANQDTEPFDADSVWDEDKIFAGRYYLQCWQEADWLGAGAEHARLAASQHGDFTLGLGRGQGLARLSEATLCSACHVLWGQLGRDCRLSIES